MNVLSDFLKGILIGVGNIAPGVSGGALAMIFGMYEKMIHAVSHFFKDIKKNTIYLVPIGLGAVIGIVAFSNVLSFLMENYPMPTSYAFAGLIIGTLPLLIRRANRRGFKVYYWAPLVLTLLIGLSFVLVETAPRVGGLASIGAFRLILGGFVLAGSLVIPGVSGSVLLILLGIYEAFLKSVSNMDIVVLLPVAIGLGLGALFFSKLMDYLLENHYGVTYYAILGFVIGALPEIITGVPGFNLISLISVFCFIAGIWLSLSLSKLEKMED